MSQETAAPVTVSDGGSARGIQRKGQDDQPSRTCLAQQLSQLNSGETIKNQALAGHNFLGLAGMMACICRWPDLWVPSLGDFVTAQGPSKEASCGAGSGRPAQAKPKRPASFATRTGP